MKNKIALAFLVVAAIAGYFVLDIGQYISLDYFSQQRQIIEAYYDQNPTLVLAGYFLIYVVLTGLSLPGAVFLTLIAGALFGLWIGLVLVSFASSIGATIAFLVSRYLLRNFVQAKYGAYLVAINAGIKKEGHFYLFMLRMIPLFPFFVVNLVMGVTPIRVGVYYLTSQIGMLLGTVVFVYAGTQLATIESPGDILTPELLAAFVCLGALPLMAKKTVSILRRRRLLADYQRPKHFDTNLVVIGAGSAGLVAAIIGSTVKAGVTLIEKSEMGGDCLNTGCVPSKALIRSAKINSYINRSSEFGIRVEQSHVDFPAVMQRIRRTIETIAPHDSVERYTGLGVHCIKGTARITGPWTVEVNGQQISTRGIVIATGAKPLVPAIPGLDKIDFYTSDSVWSMEQLPQRLLVLGGGPIGCELAQSFVRLGSEVVLVDMLERLLPREDEDVSAVIQAALGAEGVDLMLGRKAIRVEQVGGLQQLIVEHNGREEVVPFSTLLIAVGRRADTRSLGLDQLGIEINPDGTIATNRYLQTVIPSIYACGDVAGPFQFTHMASHQAWYATVNALFGWLWKFRVNYSVVPWATYTDPEVATVGLTESAARAQSVPHEVTRFNMAEVNRSVTDGESGGFIKVLTVPGSDKVLGATIVGYHGSELIGAYVTAMTQGLGLNRIMSTIHIYPTLAEVNKFAASTWKKAHAPEKLINILGRFQRWLRG